MLQNIDTKKLKLLAQASKGIAQTCCEQERSGLRYSNENLSLLWRCAQDWDAMLYLRKEHARNLRYKNGDQWCDKVPDPENPGKMIREDALISRSGKIPLKHNYLQQYIRNIHGQLLSSPTQTVVYARSKDDQPLGEMLTNALQSCHQLNKVRKLDINVVEELCLTGLACAKVRFEKRLLFRSAVRWSGMAGAPEKKKVWPARGCPHRKTQTPRIMLPHIIHCTVKAQKRDCIFTEIKMQHFCGTNDMW